MLRIDWSNHVSISPTIQLAARDLVSTNRERGQDMVEYALLIALLALAVAGVLSIFAGDLGPMYQAIINAIPGY